MDGYEEMISCDIWARMPFRLITAQSFSSLSYWTAEEVVVGPYNAEFTIPSATNVIAVGTSSGNENHALYSCLSNYSSKAFIRITN